METSKPNSTLRGHALLLATACLILPLAAGENGRSSSLAAKEESRRSAAIDEAQELLKKGDEAYNATRYADAATAYAGARDLIPNAPISADLKAAATERYAQAAVENAHQLSKKGDVAGAKAAVDKVLAKDVAPDNLAALACRAQLDDPIRTNPSLTAQDGKNIDAVRRLLYTAEGAYNLGNYTEAKRKYEEVLRIDPTNTAARRGMERIANGKTGYARSAYDHTRAESLSQVAAAWETQVPPVFDPTLVNPDGTSSKSDDVTIRAKLDNIILPQIAFEDSSLEEAIDFIRQRANEIGSTDGQDLNFTINLGPADSPAARAVREKRISLRLNNVPVSQALKYITQTTGTTYTTDNFSVLINGAGAVSDDMISRNYRVPPDFFSGINTNTAAAAAAEDPFAGGAPKEGLLARRVGAQEALAIQGIPFPPGASASYSPNSGILRVTNTSSNQEFVAQVVETLSNTEPVMVTVRLTLIKVEQRKLEELGFDWILDNFGFAGSGVGGGQQLNLSGGTTGNGSVIDDIALPTGVFERRPATAGNRSGDGAIFGDGIDNLIQNENRSQARNRAPGVLGFRGLLDQANLQVLMRGLNQSKATDVLAKPAIVTRSGQSSSITIAREFIYPTEYEPPELPNTVGDGNSSPVTPATPSAFETKTVGINLEVLPVVAANKSFVTVTLNPTFSDFDGFVNYGSPINTTSQGPFGDTRTIQLTRNQILQPVFSRQSLNTTVDVADGATIVVGGLLRQEVQNVNDHTPILGKVPILGRLFESQAKQPVSTAIVFLVNVELTDPTGHPYNER